MANEKITDLPTLTTADAADAMEIVDTSANTSKQVTVAGLATAVASSLPAGSISTADLAASAVTSAKINFGGSGAGIWWEEIGRTMLGSAGDTITVNPIAARKYLRIVVSALQAGSIRILVRFNNDSTGNYTYRTSTNGAADVTATGQGAINTIATGAVDMFAVFDVINITANEKYVIADYINSATGTAAAPGRLEFAGKWVNTSAQITRVDIVNDQAGDFAIGSEVVVLGHN